MNDGLDAATGEYIGIVEPDDYILLNMYDQYYSLAHKLKLDVVKSDFKRFWGNGSARKFELRKLTDKDAYYDTVLNPSQNIGLLHLNNVMCPGIYRRAFLKDASVRYNETPGASFQDNGFWFQVFTQAQRAIFIREPFYMIRRDNPNSSVFSSTKVFCICDEYDYIRNILLKNSDLHKFLGMCAYMRFVNYEWTCQRIADHFIPSFYERFAHDFLNLEQSGDLDRQYFAPREWARLQMIMREGSGYYLSGWLPRKEIRAQKDIAIRERRRVRSEVASVKRSNSYRLGRLLTKPIRVLKRALKNPDSPSIPGQFNIKKPYLSSEYQYYASMSQEDMPSQIRRLFARNLGGDINLSSPSSYNEKVQARKIHDPLLNEKTKLADKYLVREWVSERIGENFLVPIFGVWDCFDDIDFDQLPNQFVLKATHGCEMTIVVRNKAKFSKSEARGKFDAWMKTNFAYCNGLEMQYKNIRPRIIAEQYLENRDGDLFDYKFWCFDGKVEYIQFLSNRAEGLKMSFFDRNWNLQPFRYNYAGHDHLIEKPDHLDEMLRVAEILSKGFDHVRVDLYDTNAEEVLFGEMTFSSASGYCQWSPSEADFMMGRLWNFN